MSQVSSRAPWRAPEATASQWPRARWSSEMHLTVLIRCRCTNAHMAAQENLRSQQARPAAPSALRANLQLQQEPAPAAPVLRAIIKMFRGRRLVNSATQVRQLCTASRVRFQFCGSTRSPADSRLSSHTIAVALLLCRLGQHQQRIGVVCRLSTVRAGSLHGGGRRGRLLRMRGGRLLNHCGSIGLCTLPCWYVRQG